MGDEIGMIEDVIVQQGAEGKRESQEHERRPVDHSLNQGAQGLIMGDLRGPRAGISLP